MAKNKTTETEKSVVDFINVIDDEVKRKDAFEIVKIMQEITGFESKMWGPSIIGFGTYHYKYASGHEGDAPLIGFSPRKAAISLYIHIPADQREELLSKFGKHKTSKGCIYIKKLSDIDLNVFKEMILLSLQDLKKIHSKN